MTAAIPHALKEWAVTVEALESGEAIALLRKGGLRDAGKRFQLPYRRVLLYPTYEHQQPHLLQSPYAERVTPVPSGWRPETVRIGSWANITDAFCVCDAEALQALLPYQVGNARFAQERLRWKPQQPLSVLLLRTYRLPQPQALPYRPAYGGCRSWIELETSVSLAGATPALDENSYRERVAAVRTALGSAASGTV
ncbi:MAG: hypothetical protein BRC58_09750 [Cyanobacteria bacterium QS_8_64_29]|nr:MAG: hypothetical protein BRC58_09750 [Cyanobacteria bacterium QS_8_64_29]